MSAAALWRTVAAAFTVAVLITGVLVAWSLLAPTRSVATDTTYTTFAKSVARLVFPGFGGSDVVITAGSADRVEVRRELRWDGKKRPQSQEVWEGDTLTVSHNCGEATRDVCSMRYHITVAPGVTVQVRTTAGDVVVRGIAGAVSTEVISGDIQLEGCAGPVVVKTVSGDVNGSVRSSDVEVDGISGDVNLLFGQAPQRVTVTKTSGDTWLRVPKDSGPYRLEVETTTGDRKVGVQTDSGAQRAISVRSTSGDVILAYA